MASKSALTSPPVDDTSSLIRQAVASRGRRLEVGTMTKVAAFIRARDIVPDGRYAQERSQGGGSTHLPGRRPVFPWAERRSFVQVMSVDCMSSTGEHLFRTVPVNSCRISQYPGGATLRTRLDICNYMQVPQGYTSLYREMDRLERNELPQTQVYTSS